MNTPKTIEQRVDWKPAFKKGFVWEQDGNRGLQFFRITTEVDWEKHPDKEKLIGTRTLVQLKYLEAFIEQVITEQDRISRESERQEYREQLRFIWRWISRLNGDKPHDTPEKDWKTYVGVLVNSPNAPHQTGDWFEDDLETLNKE